MKSLLTTKTTVTLFFACIFCWMAAASIERSMSISGRSKENGQGALSARLREQIEKLRGQIKALPESRTAGAYLIEAGMREQMADLLWQEQKLQEAASELQKAYLLENRGGAGKDKIISTLNKIAAVCRDSNRYSDMVFTLRKIQTLDEKDTSLAKEVLIKDKQNIAAANFLCALSESNPGKRREQLALTQVMMEDLKNELLCHRELESLSPSEKILLATNDENQSAIFSELGDMASAKTLQDEAQTLRSALR